jgi:hypothetical protein
VYVVVDPPVTLFAAYVGAVVAPAVAFWIVMSFVASPKSSVTANVRDAVRGVPIAAEVAVRLIVSAAVAALLSQIIAEVPPAKLADVSAVVAPAVVENEPGATPVPFATAIRPPPVAVKLIPSTPARVPPVNETITGTPLGEPARMSEPASGVSVTAVTVLLPAVSEKLVFTSPAR